MRCNAWRGRRGGARGGAARAAVERASGGHQTCGVAGSRDYHRPGGRGRPGAACRTHRPTAGVSSIPIRHGHGHHVAPARPRACPGWLLASPAGAAPTGVQARRPTRQRPREPRRAPARQDNGFGRPVRKSRPRLAVETPQKKTIATGKGGAYCPPVMKPTDLIAIATATTSGTAASGEADLKAAGVSFAVALVVYFVRWLSAKLKQ